MQQEKQLDVKYEKQQLPEFPGPYLPRQARGSHSGVPVLPRPNSSFLSPTIQKCMPIIQFFVVSLKLIPSSSTHVPLAKHLKHKYNSFCERHWCPPVK